jgi:hypothetical protein
MKTRLAALAALIVTAVAGFMAIPSPASASPLEDCSYSNYWECLYPERNFVGTPDMRSAGFNGEYVGQCLELATSKKNWASSAVNQSNYRLYLYNFAQGGGNGCAGQNIETYLAPHTWLSFGTSLNDQIDAVAFIPVP